MNKKNTYIGKALIIVCVMLAPSFFVLSSYNTPRLPAGKRPQGYTGPRNIRQKRIPYVAPQTPIKIPQTAPTIDQPIQNIEQPAPEQAIAAESMPAKATASSPGWATTAYIVLLQTLNKAFGGGIQAHNKSLIKSFMTRQAFGDLKNDAQTTAQRQVESGAFDKQIKQDAAQIIKEAGISQQDPEYNQVVAELTQLINLPAQEKIALQTKSILKSQKIDIDKMEQQTSLSSILKQGVYTGMLNTFVPMVGTLIGIGAQILLQSMMPSEM